MTHHPLLVQKQFYFPTIHFFYSTKRIRRRAAAAVQEQLNLAADWFNTWCLSPNIQKTNAILIGRRSNNVKNIKISGQCIL